MTFTAFKTGSKNMPGKGASTPDATDWTLVVPVVVVLVPVVEPLNSGVVIVVLRQPVASVGKQTANASMTIS